MQLQNCPMEFKTPKDFKRYIKLQIDGNRLLLDLFPTLKYYYTEMHSKYKDSGSSTKEAKNKFEELEGDTILKPTHLDQSIKYIFNKETADVLVRKYGDVSLNKRAKDEINLAIKNFFGKKQRLANASCFEPFEHTIWERLYCRPGYNFYKTILKQ